MSFAKLAEEFADAIASATSLDELATVLAAIALELGFRYFALTHHLDIPRAPVPAIRLHNYPAAWAEYFDAQRLGPSRFDLRFQSEKVRIISIHLQAKRAEEFVILLQSMMQ